MRNVKNLSCLVQIPIVALKAIKLHQAKVSWWDILDAPFVGLQIMSVLALMTYWRRKITNWINFVRVATNLLKHKQMRWYYHIKKKSKAVKNSKKTVENTQKSLLNLQNRQKIKKKNNLLFDYHSDCFLSITTTKVIVSDHRWIDTEHLFGLTLRIRNYVSSSWFDRLRISDRKFVNHTTEMILWSMILNCNRISILK